MSSAERAGLRTKGNVPTLRFPEFSGEWKKTKLSEVCHIATGNKNTQDKDDNGQYPFYVRSQHIEHINSWTYDGEAILTAGDGVGVGKVFHYSKGKIGVHQRVYILNDFKCDGKFLFYYFSGHFYDRVKRMSAKNSVDSVRMEMIANMNLIYPRRGEQTKIGHLFSLLDERIETQNRIIEKLQSLMKGLAEHLTAFTPNTKIADCLNCHSSILQENQVKNEGKYKVYGANGICGYSDSPAILEDSILIVKDGSGVGNVSYACGEYSVIGTSNYLTAKSGYSLKYLYYCLMIFNFVPYRTGMAIPHIYFKDYGKALIYCPSLDKQVQIATLLSKIECKIEAEKAIVDSYQQQKRFLLQSMFI